jgi:hypothetical protein
MAKYMDLFESSRPYGNERAYTVLQSRLPNAKITIETPPHANNVYATHEWFVNFRNSPDLVSELTFDLEEAVVESLCYALEWEYGHLDGSDNAMNEIALAHLNEKVQEALELKALAALKGPSLRHTKPTSYIHLARKT